jgi:3-methyladenine DNA glycosylase AlkD
MTVKTPPTPPTTTAKDVRTVLVGLGDPERARQSLRFFKTGPGQYGEGDKFLGLSTPQLRALAKTYRLLPLDQVDSLLADDFHDVRSLALMILVLRYEKGDAAERERIFATYLNRLDFINNWDLVDGSAPYIVGPHLKDRDRALLDDLAASPVMWRRRVAVLATFHFIRTNELGPTLDLCDRLLGDRHHLMHKACGWMLREAMKRDRTLVEDWLIARAGRVPRTTLRYAIERLEPDRRKWHMALKSGALS